MSNVKNRLKFGEKRFVTALFLDIVSFTSFSEDRDPEDVDDMLNLYFTEFSNIIESHGGWIEKFIGDAIFAVFGKDVANVNDPVQACFSAIEIVKKVSELNKYNDQMIDVRIGMHCGIVAKSRRGRYDVVVGDTVNTSSRIQSKADEGEILISNHLANMVNQYFEIEEKGLYELKGKKEKVVLYILKKKSSIFKLDIKLSDIFKREDDENRFLKLFQEDNPLINIQGSMKNGKTTFLVEISLLIEKKFNDYDILIIQAPPYVEMSEESICLDIVSHPLFTENNEICEINKVYELFQEIKNTVVMIDDMYNVDKGLLDTVIFSNEFIELLKKNNNKIIFTSYSALIENGFVLSHLNGEESRDYVKKISHEIIPLSIENYIVKNSLGNIGLVKEFIRNYHKTGHVFAGNNFRTIIQSVIDQMDDLKKLVLSVIALSIEPISTTKIFVVASEILEEFDTESFNHDILNKLLKDLKEDGLIDSSDPFYYVKLSLVREVIYNATLKKNKKIIYKRLKNNSEQLFEEIIYHIKLNKKIDKKYLNIVKSGKSFENIQQIIKIYHEIVISKKDYRKENSYKEFCKKTSDIFEDFDNFIQYYNEIPISEYSKFSENDNLNLMYHILQKGDIFDETKVIKIGSEKLEILMLLLKDPIEFDKRVRHSDDLYNVFSKVRNFVDCDIMEFYKDINLEVENKFDLFIKIITMLFYKSIMEEKINFIFLVNTMNVLEKIVKDINIKLFQELYLLIKVFTGYVFGEDRETEYYIEIYKNITLLAEYIPAIEVFNPNIDSDFILSKRVNEMRIPFFIPTVYFYNKLCTQLASDEKFDYMSIVKTNYQLLKEHIYKNNPDSILLHTIIDKKKAKKAHPIEKLDYYTNQILNAVIVD